MKLVNFLGMFMCCTALVELMGASYPVWRNESIDIIPMKSPIGVKVMAKLTEGLKKVER